MAKVVDVPKRNRSMRPEVIANAEAMEKLLKDKPEGTYITDETEYKTKGAAQSAINRYKRILVEDKVLVSDSFKIGASVFSSNGADGPFTLALAVVSDEQAKKNKERARKANASRAAK